MKSRHLPSDALTKRANPIRTALIGAAGIVVVAGLSVGGVALGQTLQPTSVTVSTKGRATPTDTPTATATPTAEATVTDTPTPTAAPTAAPAPVATTATPYAGPTPSLGSLNPISTVPPYQVGQPIVNPHPGVPDPSLGFMATPTPTPVTR